MSGLFRRGLALVLCGCLMTLGLSGCGKKTEETEEAFDQSAAAVTLGDRQVTAGEANFMLRYQQAQFESGIGMFYSYYYGITDYWSADMNGTGQPYSEIFKEQLADDIQKMLQAEAHMEEYGVEITDSEKEQISAAAEAFLSDNGEEVLKRMSATKENVERILTLYTIKAKVEEAMSADVDTFVSDEEAAQRTVSYVSFTTSTEQEETEPLSEGEELLSEAAEALSEAAEALSEAALDKETEVKTSSADTEKEEAVSEAAESALEEDDGAEALTEEQTEAETEDPARTAAREETRAKAQAFLEKAQGAADAEAFQALADESFADESNVHSSSYTFGSADTYPDAAIISATEGLDDNTLVDHVVQVGDTFYVLFVDDAFDEEATEDEKVTIVENRKNEKIRDLYSQWQEEEEAVTASDVFALLLMDYSLTLETEANAGTDEDAEALSEADQAEEAVSEAAEAAEAISEEAEVMESVSEAAAEGTTEAAE